MPIVDNSIRPSLPPSHLPVTTFQFFLMDSMSSILFLHLVVMYILYNIQSFMFLVLSNELLLQILATFCCMKIQFNSQTTISRVKDCVFKPILLLSILTVLLLSILMVPSLSIFIVPSLSILMVLSLHVYSAFTFYTHSSVILYSYRTVGTKLIEPFFAEHLLSFYNSLSNFTITQFNNKLTLYT